MQQRQEIKRYILQNFLFADDDSSLGDQDALIAGGITSPAWETGMRADQRV